MSKSSLRFKATIAAAALLACGGGSDVTAKAIASDEEAVPAASEPNHARPRLTDLALNAQTRREEVIARWGAPLRFGPGGEMDAYLLASGEMLWLSFAAEQPRLLSRAIVLSNDQRAETRILMNRLDVTERRRIDQLDLSRTLSAEDVYAAWGPPDGLIGSGFQIWIYRLADGGAAPLVFSDGHVVGSGANSENSGDTN